MAIKCLHSNHSNPDDQQKCRKIHGEQVTETKRMKTNGDTYNLVHVKHDWYNKGDSIVIHLYVKCLHENLLDVILHEDHLQVKFATSNAEFLKMYQGTTGNTLFSWSLKLRGKVDLAKSSCRVAKAYLEMSLKKRSSESWNGLERLNKPGLKETTMSSADKPFRQLFGYKSKIEDSECEQNLTNGIQHFNNLYTCKDIGCRSKESAGTAAGSSSVDEKEVRRNSLEEKSDSNEDSNSTMGSVTPSSNLHNNGERQCGNCGPCDVGTSYLSKYIPQDIETGEFLQVCDRNTPLGFQSKFKQTCVRTSDSSVTEPDSAGSKESSSSHSNTPSCNAKYTMALSTTEKLTVAFSSLPNAVQSSILTSASSSLSASESTYMSSSRAPMPAPPPPPKAPILQGCDESQVKAGMMGGSRSKTAELPFSDAIRAAASKDSDCNSYITEDHGTGVFTEESDPPGYTGLDNLGNTCYLNSIVQCLANARKLRDFFLADNYKDDINTENPLGTGGRLAIVFASLMKNLWSGKERSLSTYKLKSVVGEKVCQFKGFMQQDAQEFMAFLLDGLHEDLNRVREKPYIEEVEGAGKPDSEVAYEAWKRYKSRNDSIIVDLFQGQLKSKLTCPICKKISIKYDPFMNLSVPLPKEVKPVPVYVFFKDCRRLPLKVVVQVAQDATVEQLTGAVEHKTGIRPENMRVYEVFNGKFHKAFPKGSSLSSVVESDIIVVYEVLSEEEAGEEVYEVPIIQRLVWPNVVPAQCASCYKSAGPCEDLKRCTQCWTIGYCNPKCQKEHWSIHKRSCKRIIPQPVGIPFVVSLPASQATFKNLQYMAEEYSKYSVEVHPGERFKKALLTKGECSIDVNLAAGDTAQEGPCSSKENWPKLFFKPVTAYGEAVIGEDGARLKDEGSRPLNLSDKYLSLDWRNHPRSSGFVVAEEKDNLEFDEHPSCITETAKELYSCSLRECLELFTEPETLSENDAWYCPHCKAHREATKQLSVWRLPEILIIHLKRFSFRNILFRDKITKLVDFPLKGLDMSGFTLGRDDKDGSLYDLFAVANHSGTVSFGHYTALARLAEADSSIEGLKRDGLGWRCFDDRNVTETSEQRVVSKYAYVLFYKRRHDSDSPTEQAPMADTPTEEKKASLEDVDENELD